MEVIRRHDYNYIIFLFTFFSSELIQFIVVKSAQAVNKGYDNSRFFLDVFFVSCAQKLRMFFHLKANKMYSDPGCADINQPKYKEYRL